MLQGKTALVTGCNRGIGKAIIEKFAKDGANLITVTRTQSTEFDDFLKSLESTYNTTVIQLHFDITDTEAMKEQVKGLIKEKTPIDILVNNAAMPHGGLFTMTSMKTIHEVFNTNLFAQMELTQFVLKVMMRAKRGSIINVGSVLGLDLPAGVSSYGVAKAALMAWTKTLSKETGPFNVRVNAIAPGIIDTQMGAQTDEKVVAKMLESAGIKRLGTVDEVANTVAFLASDDSQYVTGQILRVDGGI
ncbi:MAG: SDR family NAD(P)-dependent oxidoreductase [Succinatimonas sp.]|nr:SDR family NAD(P)-dependent oxidoreductase [Succinatimonas sp.]